MEPDTDWNLPMKEIDRDSQDGAGLLMQHFGVRSRNAVALTDVV